MAPSSWRRFGIREAIPAALFCLLIAFAPTTSTAQQALDASIMQTPQVVKFGVPMPPNVPPAPDIDPTTLINIPVTVIDHHGRCVDSLDARDFSLRVDGWKSPIALFRRNRATAAALGVLVDISQGMSFQSFSGPLYSKIPSALDAVESLLARLDSQDRVFLAAFARRFHIIEDLTTDHQAIDDRLSMVRPADRSERDADGIYESMIKGIAMLANASKSDDRRALVVFTSALYDTSTHGVEDVIARAQFAGVTVYNVVLLGYAHDTDPSVIRGTIGRIADETGGQTFILKWRDEGDILDAAAEVTSELDSQYVVGFAPMPSHDGVLGVNLTMSDPALSVHAPRAVRFRRDRFKGQLSMMLPE
ncbi:MAG TPA: VWA domain-containing protein [Candidatus Binataceae bacterium]|nr:VWA domain-containing protein [Candidatus Binataceae bacterium]